MHKKGFYENYLKRMFDLIGSLAALILLSPVILTVAVLVKIKLGSPVLFSQKRAGLHENEFSILKFRSMTDQRDSNGDLMPDEIRLTLFGRKLRSTSLDELPSLINILKGDMSIIGPRALPVDYIPYYTKDEHHRHDVRPGLSGLAQVNGRNYVTWEDKFKMDLKYISNITFWGDVKLILRTVSVVFKQEDIDTGSYIEKDGHIFRPLNVERADSVEN
jgi:lipopolysaccharide/colanic/teichoic acid biosynthesis glycosyltransferase